MDTRWFKLLPDTRGTVLHVFNDTMADLSSQGVANALYGFGLMGQ